MGGYKLPGDASGGGATIVYIYGIYIYGIYIYIWSIYGMYMVYIWYLYGIYMVYIWYIHGIYIYMVYIHTHYKQQVNKNFDT